MMLIKTKQPERLFKSIIVFFPIQQRNDKTAEPRTQDLKHFHIIPHGFEVGYNTVLHHHKLVWKKFHLFEFLRT